MDEITPDASPLLAAAAGGPPEPARKTWTAGTLVYTPATLAGLFFLLLFGDFAWSMRDRSVGQMAQWYLTELKVPSFLFAVLSTSLPAVIALILGPVISVRSDRHRGRWGRRIPYLLITTPMAVFGMVGLALSPMIAGWVRHALGGGVESHGLRGGTVVPVLCFALFWTAFELATNAGQAVFGGLINDVVPKPLMGRFYGLFRGISLIDGMIFNEYIFGQVTAYYTLILLSISLVYGACFMTVCLLVKEGAYPPPPPAAAELSGGSTWMRWWAGIRSYLRECFSHRYYVLVFCLLMFAQFTFLPVNTFSLPYSKSMHVEPKVIGHYFYITYLISLCLAFPLGWLVDRIHPLRVVIGSLAVYAFITFWGSFFISNVTIFLFTFVAHGVISGCYWTAVASLPNRLFPASRFAQFASAAGVLTALGGIVVAPALGALIDATGKSYQYAYVGGLFFCLTALYFGWRVHRRFMALGGPAGYQPPDPAAGL